MRVLAALSGGVDSAVAAARAVDAGHDVVGVHLALAPDPQAFREGARGCCSLDDARDARRVADVLGIPYYVWDMAAEFRAEVIDDFVAEYAAGRTPHPCLRCNERIKFAAVLDRAVALDFDAVATGHYARLVAGADGVQLHRAVDSSKDQSYVLAVLVAEQLQRAMFPLGDDLKESVRAEARERGLLVADKPDSHDLCFVPGASADYVRDRVGSLAGPVIDAESGEEIGQHDGTYAFTIGQRRGLHLGVPRTDGRPRYVVGVDADTRTVLVGPEELLGVDSIRGDHVRWCGARVADDERVEVQVRAHGRTTPGVVRHRDDGIELQLDTVERGVAPGQAAVLYQGTWVRGSATITSTARKPQVPAAG